MKNLFFKLFLLMTVLVMGVGMSSCNGAKAKLKQDVVESNRTLPQPVGPGITLEKLKYEGNDLVFTYTIDNSLGIYNEDFLDKGCDLLFVELLTNDDPEVANVRKLAKDAKANIVMVVRLSTGESKSKVLGFGEY